MLRVYFKYNRGLLTKLCRCAHESLLVFLRNATGLQTGIPGLVMTIHTFGNYPEKFHPHLHAIVTDGLFNKNGTFYVMPETDLRPLEEIFRAAVFSMLKEEGKITDEIIDKLMKWRHSGFNIDNGMRISRDDEKGRESVAQYILRNPFSIEKMTYNDKNGTVIYRSKMTHGKNKKNFNAYRAEEFIAAITQHIPEKSFQMVRYYGWYSNKSRGMRLKQGMVRPGDEPLENEGEVEIIDVSEYEPKRIPSKTWRECIKKIWEVDPLECPNCGGEMKIISFITEASVIRQILEHLNLWAEKLSRDPPDIEPFTETIGVVREPFDDGWAHYDEYSTPSYSA